MITKTRKQGNSLTLTVPKKFDIPTGIEVEAKLIENGILYEFVEKKPDFFDFSEDLISDIISEGFDKENILEEFKNRKSNLMGSFSSLKTTTLDKESVMSKEELAKEIGL